MTLLEKIKRDPNIRKIFGRQEIVIIEKQLYDIDLTQSEKNRLSRDIRKKLDAIRSIAHYEDEFELKKGQETSKITESIREVILKSKKSQSVTRISFISIWPDKKSSVPIINFYARYSKIGIKDAANIRATVNRETLDNTKFFVYNLMNKKMKEQIDKRSKSIYEK